MERSWLRFIPGITDVLALDREDRNELWGVPEVSDNTGKRKELVRVVHLLEDMPGRKD